MSNTYFGRRVEIEINDEVFIAQTPGRTFKITFETTTDFNAALSYAEISIYGMDRRTISSEIKRGTIIGLKAGYADSIDFIFRGVVQNVFPDRDGPDTIVRILARTTDVRNRLPMNESVGRGASVSEAIRRVARALRVASDFNDTDFIDDIFDDGYTLSGDPIQVIDELKRQYNFDYVVELDRRLVAVKGGQSRQAPTLDFNMFNGLEDIPEITEIGVDFSVRITPQIRIGSLVRIESEIASFNFGNAYFREAPPIDAAGTYRVVRIGVSGDTHGDNWTMNVVTIRV